MLGSLSRGRITLLIHEITFRLSQLSMYVITIHQRYRQTDGQTTYDSNTALRAVNL